MRALAIDTTTARGSVAVATPDEVLGEVRLVTADSHSGRVLPAVAFLLESLDLTPAALDGFVVAVGPGSFTGLRVGIATVQGLALGSGRPCVGVPVLDVLAERGRGSSRHVVALMDAYRGEVFGAVYDAEAHLCGERRLASPEAFLRDVPAGAAFLGDGASKYRELVRATCAGAVFPDRSLFLAGTLGRLGARQLAAGAGVPPDALRPLYLREADIRKPQP